MKDGEAVQIVYMKEGTFAVGKYPKSDGRFHICNHLGNSQASFPTFEEAFEELKKERWQSGAVDDGSSASLENL